MGKEIVCSGLKPPKHVELPRASADHDDRHIRLPRHVFVIGLTYLFEQLERSSRGVETSEYGQPRCTGAGQYAGVLGGARKHGRVAICGELLDERAAKVRVGLHNENRLAGASDPPRSHADSSHHSSTSRGLTPSPSRAINASTSL